MRAFHSNLKIKRKYIARVEAHEKADEIIKGVYWENGKGCAVGCTIHSSYHDSYETELGIPKVLARLEDGLFECLPNNLAKTWPKQFLESIKVGADLSLVWPKFVVWLLADEEHGIIKFAITEHQQEVILTVSDLYQAQVEGLEVDSKDFLKASDAAVASASANAAAWAAAYAAWASVSASANAAVASASANAAAWADDVAAYADTREKAIIKQSEKLLELLRKAK